MRVQSPTPPTQLVSLGAMQRMHLLVIQNVDGLHQRAGGTEVVELHGNLGRVICLGCGATEARETVQVRSSWPPSAGMDAFAHRIGRRTPLHLP